MADHPRMALRGVRSSCETVARNSSLPALRAAAVLGLKPGCLMSKPPCWRLRASYGDSAGRRRALNLVAQLVAHREQTPDRFDRRPLPPVSSVDIARARLNITVAHERASAIL